MLVSLVMVISCGILLVQCLGFYQLIPMYSLTMLGSENLLVYYLHACICKWGLPFAALGLILGLVCLFDTKNKTYCSDLITKVFSSVGIDTNKDGYFTTIYDIITTEELYITYYHYYKDGIKYIYYV